MLEIILFGFYMLFTALSKFKSNDHHKKNYCSDTNFEMALLLLIPIYL
ncbi:hypothetical protein FPC831_1770001 [Flavobacterium psychrophilum]|nr:hypothetical protein FPC831_1770001 [Flavobacterium psychrophilum]